MIAWIRDHSLSLVIIGLFWSFTIAAGIARLLDGKPLDWEFLYDMFQGLAHDTFGAFIIVSFTKWFVERGRHPSKESK